MAFEFDHLFICTSVGGAEADQLAAFGLTESAPNTHPGQGTACRRFFFANCYLELLWVCDASEARSEASHATRLYDRWVNRTAGACPFGFGFRPKIQHDGGAPFSSWEYRPAYLPQELSIHIGTNTNVLHEPMLFYLSFAQRPDAYPSARGPAVRHKCGLREITRVALAGPRIGNPSPELTSVAGTGLVQLRGGSEYLVELGFDGESRGEQADFRPSLPLVFRW